MFAHLLDVVHVRISEAARLFSSPCGLSQTSVPNSVRLFGSVLSGTGPLAISLLSRITWNTLDVCSALCLCSIGKFFSGTGLKSFRSSLTLSSMWTTHLIFRCATPRLRFLLQSTYETDDPHEEAPGSRTTLLELRVLCREAPGASSKRMVQSGVDSELPKVFNEGICLTSYRGYNYGFGYIP